MEKMSPLDKALVEKYTKETRAILDKLRTERYSLSGTHLLIISKIEEALEFGRKKVEDDQSCIMGGRAAG